MSGDIYYCSKSLDPDVPENWEKLEGIEPTGYSVGPVSVDEGSDWDTPIKVEPVYGWGNLEARYLSNVLGQWPETPREELKRRLNNWLQGTHPGEPINWKGLK